MKIGLVNSWRRYSDKSAFFTLVTGLGAAFSASAEGVFSQDIAYIGPIYGERSLPRVQPAITEAAQPAEWFGETPCWEWSRLTGDWGKIRPGLEEKGLSFAGSYTLDTSTVLDGGSRHRTISRGLLDLNFTFDPKPALGIEGGTFFAQYYFRHGPNGSDDTGDIQGYDAIDGQELSRAGEFWYEQKLGGDHVRVKIGQVDANAEFAFVAPGGDFINSSAGNSLTMYDIPTFPDPALSFNAFAYPTEWFYCGAGVYTKNVLHLDSASFDHPYLIGETGFTHAGYKRLGPGRVAAGLWQVTGTVDRFDGATEDCTTGWFLVAEQQVWKEKPGDKEDTQGASLFFQYGWADPEVSEAHQHVGVGLSATGLLPGRDDDITGVYYSRLELSREVGAGLDHDETMVEWFYRLQVTPFFAIQPDVQWISHPGGQATPNQAWVATLRVTMDF